MLPKKNEENNSNRILKLAEEQQKGSSVLEMGKQLLLKSKLGNAQEVLDLLSKGAPFATDWVGTSPLHWAAFYNHVEVAETLLLAGICRDAKNKVNRTPLHVAAQKGHHQVIEILLSHGADVNCKDILKMTPLHWAAESGSKESAQLLLDYGADVTQINVFDKNAAFIAKDCNHFEILKLIEEITALDPAVRAVTIRLLKQRCKTKFTYVKPKTVENVNSNNFSALTLKVVPRKQKIGIVVDKTNVASGVKKIELIKNECVSSANSNTATNTTTNNLTTQAIAVDSNNEPVTSALNGQTDLLPVGEAVCTSLKGSSFSSPTSTSSANSKKIITIKADELINMTKEKKVIITDSRPISNARFFEGKLYTEDQKDELAQKVTTKLQEAKKEAEHLISQLKKVNDDIDGYNKLLGSLHKTWPVH